MRWHEVGSARSLHAFPEWDALDCPALDAVTLAVSIGRTSVGRAFCSKNRIARRVSVLGELFEGLECGAIIIVIKGSPVELGLFFVEDSV